MEDLRLQSKMVELGHQATPIRATYQCSVCGQVIRSECWLRAGDDTPCRVSEHCGEPMLRLANGWPDVKSLRDVKNPPVSKPLGPFEVMMWAQAIGLVVFLLFIALMWPW